jgi:hypothetical protein
MLFNVPPFRGWRSAAILESVKIPKNVVEKLAGHSGANEGLSVKRNILRFGFKSIRPFALIAHVERKDWNRGWDSTSEEKHGGCRS